MKRILLVLLTLFTMTFAKAQTKQPTMVETTRDTLHPEIVNRWGYQWDPTYTDTIWLYEYFQHPSTELICGGAGGDFMTLERYAQYQWEVNKDEIQANGYWFGGDLNSYHVNFQWFHLFSLKVTVWDTLGNTGTDSIWFDIKDWIGPMEDFLMEIDSAGHPCFSGTIVSRDYANIDIRYFEDSIPYLHAVYDSLGTFLYFDTLYRPNEHMVANFPVHFGQHWSYTDVNYVFNEESNRYYYVLAGDTCGIGYGLEMVPGLVMGTQPAPGGGWYLTMKSVLQSNKKEGELRDDEEYVYALYTIDHQGVRHPYVREGSQVILPTSTQAYLLPGRHPDEYYQGGVGKLTGGRDGELQILSYSNKVENPLPDLDDVGDLNGDGTNATGLKVWPNPNNGTFTVEGEGRLKVFNLLGQAVIDRDIDGKLTLTLPSGMYLVRLVNGTTNETVKVVVE